MGEQRVTLRLPHGTFAGTIEFHDTPAPAKVEGGMPALEVLLQMMRDAHRAIGVKDWCVSSLALSDFAEALARRLAPKLAADSVEGIVEETNELSARQCVRWQDAMATILSRHVTERKKVTREALIRAAAEYIRQEPLTRSWFDAVRLAWVELEGGGK